ncbi:MAG TPA: Uma2 family endonuclease [Blastocatellia bacterium]|nr:Uma2 family endonuclease [Blastocatellia bacterium]
MAVEVIGDLERQERAHPHRHGSEHLVSDVEVIVGVTGTPASDDSIVGVLAQGTVACGAPEVENIRGVDALLNPAVIVEVISPTTEARDRGEKFSAYQQIPGFMEYLLVAQQSARVSHYVRNPDGIWVPQEVAGTESAAVRLDSLDCELTLAEIYQGVSFGTPNR